MLASILGWISTVVFSICVIPQIVKTHKVKKVDEISFSYWFLFLIGNVTALWYAILIMQPPLIFKYIFALITSLWIVLAWLYYNRRNT